MADSEEKLKSILMRVKEMNEKVSLKLSSPYVVVILKKKKLSSQKLKIMTSSPITSWEIEGGGNRNSDIFYFWGASKSL